jgi:hypothetical protein
MSTENKVSKSRLALEYLTANPTATNKEVIAGLSQFEVKISDVNNAKQKLRSAPTKSGAAGPKKRGPKPKKGTKATVAIALNVPKKRGRKPLKKVAAARTPLASSAAKSTIESNNGPYALLEAGVRFIEVTGSIESARELLTLIEKCKTI